MVPNAMSPNNTVWQEGMHRSVLELDPAAVGHNVRFLSNGVVQLLEVATGRYALGRTVYRLTFQFLLLLAIYDLGRRWFDHATSIGGVLAYALIYPISIRYYAGQPLDPMTHLSFVLAIRFVVTGPFAYVLTTLFVGLMAKESVILVAAWHAVTRWREPGHLGRALLLLGGEREPGLDRGPPDLERPLQLALRGAELRARSHSARPSGGRDGVRLLVRRARGSEDLSGSAARARRGDRPRAAVARPSGAQRKPSRVRRLGRA